MKVLMFGWEFPPISSGGLGTACYGLTKGLSRKADITLVLPYVHSSMDKSFMKIVSALRIKVEQVDTIIRPYMTAEMYTKKYYQMPENSIYGADLFSEVERYSNTASKIALRESHDVIHCHDWMTYGAGVKAKRASGKPLVLHVHATEFDRTGGNVNPRVYDLERKGMEEADAIITVSQYTKNMVMQHYGISGSKIYVVHNAVENPGSAERISVSGRKIVLFLGRLTLQKGPEYFLYAAKRALEKEPDAIFIMAGSGDMQHFLIEKAAELGIADKVLFSGFLEGEDIRKAYKMADVYVMPSVSEPFGIAPLEAMIQGTPVIISKTSGVSEVIKHCLKVDFWDIDELANKILSVLKYSTLKDELSFMGKKEARKFSWNDSADKCIEVYNRLIW